MAYNREIYAKASSEIKRRRHEAEIDRKLRHDEVCLKIPEILEIEREMARTGAEAVKAIGLGSNADEYIEKISRTNLDAQAMRSKLLTDNGYPADYLDIRYTCPKCEDTGYIGQNYCDCYHELVRKYAFEKISGATPMKLSSFDDFRLDYYPSRLDAESGVVPMEHMRNIRDFCVEYAKDFSLKSGNLLMYGRTGLGKTHLSLAIAAEVTKKGYSVIYDSAQNILTRIEKEHFGRSDSSDDTLSEVCTCDLLILDDLGSEFQTNFTLSAIYTIINNRLLASVPTIISTNLENRKLEEKYGERIASRIMGSYVNLGFCGNDIRQMK